MGRAEGVVEHYLVRKAAKQGILCLKLQFVNIAGAPDRLLVHQGATWFVECKRERHGRIRAQQKYRQWQLQQAGAMVVNVFTRDEVDRLLEQVRTHWAPALALDDPLDKNALHAALARLQARPEGPPPDLDALADNRPQ